jgi:hypothetical protein
MLMDPCKLVAQRRGHQRGDGGQGDPDYRSGSSGLGPASLRAGIEVTG